jgi:3-phenylpropionate/cinnamic acid dioxygenase small subunit
MTDATDSTRRWRLYQLWAAYAHRADDGDAASWTQLFTEDAVVDLGERVLTGHAEIQVFAAQRDAAAGRHLVVNVETTSNPALDHVEIVADFVFLPTSGGEGPTAMGRYHSILRWDGDGWLIARHRIERA